MKKSIKFLSLLISLSVLTFFISCTDDEPVIDIGDGDVIVSDGFYIIGAGAPSETPAASGIMSAGLVEGDGFSAELRTGYYETYIYLKAAGGIQFASYSDNVATTYGGTVETVTQKSDGEISFDYLAGSLAKDGASVTPLAAGLHHVVVDMQTSTFLVVPIKEINIAGSARDAVSYTFKTISEDGMTYSGSVVIRGGAWKLRYNDSWKIDRRTDPSLGYVDGNGYVAFSNFGGTVESLEPGAGNIDALAAGTGAYTFSLTFKNGSSSPKLTTTRTGDAPAVTFDPEQNKWGLKGSASKKGWDTVIPFFYSKSEDNIHKYINVLWLNKNDALADSEFGFGKVVGDGFIGFNGATITDNSGKITSAAGGNFLVGESGFYTLLLTSADDGDNWKVDIKKTSFGIIGDGVGGWDADKATMALETGSDSTFVVTHTLVADKDWKFRADQAWDFGIGGPLDNLVVNSFDNINIAASGSKKITLTLHASGTKFSATVE